MDRDAGDRPARQRGLERVLHAHRGRADDRDAIAERLVRDPAGQRIVECVLGEAVAPRAPIDQHLIAARVDARITSIVRLERREGRGAEPQVLRPVGIGAQLDALRAQVMQRELQGEPDRRAVFGVPEQEQPAPHDAVAVGDDVGEAHRPGIASELRGRDAGKAGLRELLDEHETGRARRDRGERGAAGRVADRDVAVDVDADRARLRARDPLERARERGVGQRVPERLDLLLADVYERNR